MNLEIKKNVWKYLNGFLGFLILSLFVGHAIAASNPIKLVKTSGDPTIYYVNPNGLRVALPSGKVFLSYKFKWKNVQTVSLMDLAAYRQANYIKLAKINKIFRLQNGEKKFVTPEAAVILKINSSDVFEVNKTHFDFYRTSSDVTAEEAVVMSEGKVAGAETVDATQGCTEDPTVGGKDGCVIYSAMTNQDVSLCSGITDSAWKGSCYSSFDGDSGNPLSNCKKIYNDDTARQECISRVATKAKDLGLCDAITSNDKKIECRANVGVMLKNIQLCEALPDYRNDQDKASKDSCYYSYALLNNDSAACAKISQGSPYRDSCQKFSSQINQALSQPSRQ